MISCLSQVSPGACVHIGERASTLNPELRRPSIAALLPLVHQRASIASNLADVRHGRVHGGHHDTRLPGGPRPGQATPLRSVRFAAHGLDRTAAPPVFGNYVMTSRLTVALMRDVPIHPRRSRGVMIRSREQRNRRARCGRTRPTRDRCDESLRALVRTLARQAARELFARELMAQRQDRPEVTVQ